MVSDRQHAKDATCWQSQQPRVKHHYMTTCYYVICHETQPIAHRSQHQVRSTESAHVAYIDRCGVNASVII